MLGMQTKTTIFDLQVKKLGLPLRGQNTYTSDQYDYIFNTCQLHLQPWIHICNLSD